MSSPETSTTTFSSAAAEGERRLVVGRHRRAVVAPAGEAVGDPDVERDGDREVGLPGQLAVDVELGARRRPLAVREVGLAGRLELEAELVPPVGDRGVARQVVLLDAEEVVGVVELVVLDVERVAAGVPPCATSTPSAPFASSTVAVMLCGRLRTRAAILFETAEVPG